MGLVQPRKGIRREVSIVRVGVRLSSETCWQNPQPKATVSSLICICMVGDQVHVDTKRSIPPMTESNP